MYELRTRNRILCTKQTKRYCTALILIEQNSKSKSQTSLNCCALKQIYRYLGSYIINTWVM